jgi:hypothetical protein
LAGSCHERLAIEESNKTQPAPQKIIGRTDLETNLKTALFELFSVVYPTLSPLSSSDIYNSSGVSALTAIFYQHNIPITNITSLLSDITTLTQALAVSKDTTYINTLYTQTILSYFELQNDFPSDPIPARCFDEWYINQAEINAAGVGCALISALLEGAGIGACFGGWVAATALNYRDFLWCINNY